MTSSVYTWFNNNCAYVCVCAHTHIHIERSSKILSIMSESSKRSIMLKKTEVLHVCEMIIQSLWFSVEFIWFIPILMLYTDWKNRIYIVCCSDESMLIQNKSSACCQIWETNLYDTYMIVVKRLKKKMKQKTTCWQAIRTLSTNLT